MKNTWLLSSLKSQEFTLLEYTYHFYFFFNLLLNSFLYYFHFYKFIFFYKKLRFVLQKTLRILKTPVLTNKKLNGYANLQTSSKLIAEKSFTIFKPARVTAYKFKNKFTDFKSKIFNLFLFSNFTSNSDHFYCHYNFKFFYLHTSKGHVLLVDTKKFLARWEDAWNLLFNVFFYNFNLVLFGSPFFKKETLALNWNYRNFDANIWKFYFPFFIFKANAYNAKTGFFFKKLANFNINFYLIADCFYHFKNLFYIRKNGYYSVGLVTINSDPWVVSYPIVNFFESLISQLFFFKLLILIQRQVYFLQFKFFKNLWINTRVQLTELRLR